MILVSLIVRKHQKVGRKEMVKFFFKFIFNSLLNKLVPLSEFYLIQNPALLRVCKIHYRIKNVRCCFLNKPLLLP